MSPDGLRGGGAVATSAGGPPWKIAIPSTPPPHHWVEGVRSGAAELALRGEANSALGDERCYVPYYRKMLRPVLLEQFPVQGQDRIRAPPSAP